MNKLQSAGNGPAVDGCCNLARPGVARDSLLCIIFQIRWARRWRPSAADPTDLRSRRQSAGIPAMAAQLVKVVLYSLLPAREPLAAAGTARQHR